MPEENNIMEEKNENIKSIDESSGNTSLDGTAKDGENRKHNLKERAGQKTAEVGNGNEFSKSKHQVSSASANNLDFILDIPLEVTVELGRTDMVIYELLQLGQGSIIELNKLAGEPLDILINQKLIARGEVVVVNEKLGVRLTDIISPSERVEKLG